MSIRPYVRIARPEYWANHVFIVPGILLAFLYIPGWPTAATLGRVALAIVCACLVASSNYVLNEILDAPKDRFHPEKKNRPVASGQVSLPIAYAEWLVLAALGFALAFYLMRPLG